MINVGIGVRKGGSGIDLFDVDGFHYYEFYLIQVV